MTRTPIAPHPGEWHSLPAFVDVCEACGTRDQLVPGTDRCVRCDEQARAVAKRGGWAVSAVQQQLLATGSHFEPTGPNADGPQLEVCDACRCDLTWQPGLCPTPHVHRWVDPGPADLGEEPGEEVA